MTVLLDQVTFDLSALDHPLKVSTLVIMHQSLLLERNKVKGIELSCCIFPGTHLCLLCENLCYILFGSDEYTALSIIEIFRRSLRPSLFPESFMIPCRRQRSYNDYLTFTLSKPLISTRPSSIHEPLPLP